MTVAIGHEIRQKRSQKTYDALIAATFALLQKREFDDISIAELSRKAGYSVGAFYSRFQSKDELFTAMIARHIEGRKVARERLFSAAPDSRLIEAYIEETVTYYWQHRRFWRAALMRSIRDPDFWEPIRTQRHGLAASLIDRICARIKRALTEAEEMDVRFAAQLVLSTINNAIINRPGPVLIGQELFVENLSRAFRLVSGYDELITAKVAKQGQ
jgi:AcrR family transcriptional regulator